MIKKLKLQTYYKLLTVPFNLLTWKQGTYTLRNNSTFESIVKFSQTIVNFLKQGRDRNLFHPQVLFHFRSRFIFFLFLPRIRMSGRGFATSSPRLTLPIGQTFRRLAHAFPPHAAIFRLRYVGKHGVFENGGHRYWVGRFRCSCKDNVNTTLALFSSVFL